MIDKDQSVSVDVPASEGSLNIWRTKKGRRMEINVMSKHIARPSLIGCPQMSNMKWWKLQP